MIKYKRILTNIHLISLAFCLIALGLNILTDYYFYFNWIVPFFTLGLITSGLFLFVLYARSSNLWLKIYGGLFFTYPLIILAGALFSRMMLLFGVGLPLFLLSIESNLYIGEGMMIREGFSGVLAASPKIQLYETHFPLIKKLGVAYINHDIFQELKIDSIKVSKVTGDTIILQSEPDHRQLEFRKE
ncbi:hypothetical protein [Pedobacter hiemivivus]|uniref:Uncharacterized protein n=1 Tax=Pedobacter hiemivivus TaxID=2530454 RepID=A0A4R0NL04_9SPHI|nr:hypothetical protein [Pedobacter hiemivivus]TCC99674.1 hypothetical protein EZ444_03110 [Pedobacter hiemivivus]